jgi:hypothetical protein
VTLIPVEDAVATTPVGAVGAEYVLADAVGVTVEAMRAIVIARAEAARRFFIMGGILLSGSPPFGDLKITFE